MTVLPLHRIAADARHVAIVDIGSNSIRLVVYNRIARSPVAIFNEKAVCALGQGLGESGRLNPDGLDEAIATLARFIRLARAMGIPSPHVLATAAVRDASDGPDFVEHVKRRCSVDVTVLSGREEAELAAMGVLCSTPDADGTVADLGGGSLELVALTHGALSGPYGTFPLGVLRLSDACDGDRDRASGIIDSHLATADWCAQGRGRPLYAVGGAWRAIARLCIAQTGHPLHVLDNYTLERPDALRLIDLISRQSRKSLEKIPGLSKRRLPHLPMAALVLEKLLAKIEPSKLVFSVYGMREGQFYKSLPPDIRAQDPLLAACTEMARTASRFPEHGQEMLDWMSPLFPNEPAARARLRYAACLLSDVFWNEHPDYRGEQAFLRVFRLPFMGLGHQDRASLALAVHSRYQGETELPQAEAANQLLNEEEQRHARIVGLALRLGHSISGGVPGLLRTTRLIPRGEVLMLDVPKIEPAFSTDLNERRYDRLARAAGFSRFEIRRV